MALQLETREDREADYQRTAVLGRALADPKRLCVLESLAEGELSVSELAGRVACQVPLQRSPVMTPRHAPVP